MQPRPRCWVSYALTGNVPVPANERPSRDASGLQPLEKRSEAAARGNASGSVKRPHEIWSISVVALSTAAHWPPVCSSQTAVGSSVGSQRNDAPVWPRWQRPSLSDTCYRPYALTATPPVILTATLSTQRTPVPQSAPHHIVPTHKPPLPITAPRHLLSPPSPPSNATPFTTHPHPPPDDLPRPLPPDPNPTPPYPPAIILGGGAGTRLYPLTKQRAKPAVPIGGAYRLIDVPMSNCINSGISKIYILTQFNSTSLNRHLARTYNMGSGVRFGGDGFVEVLAATQVCGGEMGGGRS